MMRALFANGVRGFHLCTLNLEKSVTKVLELLEWVEPGATRTNSKPTQRKVRSASSFLPLPLFADVLSTSQPATNGAPLPKAVNSLRPGTDNTPGGVASGGNVAGPDIARKDSPASWDEFPNGRFGDARSPAYGEMDGYGVGLKMAVRFLPSLPPFSIRRELTRLREQPVEAIRLWGEPVALADVSRIFSSYLRGTLTSNPWSEEPLRAETATISSHLIEMNDSRHWFSVGSQPAVDGAPSADLVHGFGPKGGYVYQKAFVEFFLTERELDELERRSKEDEEKRKEQGEADDGLVKFMAGNAKGEFRTNMGKGDVNAVTWGVFGGKEIVTTTLIEEMSFRAWNVRPSSPSSPSHRR